jgi:hypothetical protein
VEQGVGQLVYECLHPLRGCVRTRTRIRRAMTASVG